MNAETGEIVRRFGGRGQRVRSVDFSPDGSLIASAGAALKLWHRRSGRVIHTLGAGSAHSVRFSGDGRQVLSDGPDGILRLWDVSSGELTRSFQGHTGEVTAVAFCPGGRAISAGADGTARLWDLETGKCLAKLAIFVGHDDATHWVCLTAPGYFTCSEGAEEYITVRKHGTLQVEPVMLHHAHLRDPEAVAEFLAPGGSGE